ncbi:MAG: oligopeptide/dipeptide ABC transporter ATP-binding protein [Nitrosotalea sp.]
MEEILSVRNLKKYFVSGGFSRHKDIARAVDEISFSIKNGETFVLAGESGSGKTTIARLILRAIEPDCGEIIFDGVPITRDNLKEIRRECQMIHQDPYASINPRMKVFDIIKEPLDIHGIGSSNERENLVFEALHEVRLEPAEEIAAKNPHMLSGGQRQRVVIARAIVTKPKLVIADEPVSMLDVSVRSGILELMKELQQKLGVSFLYITHDLSTARYIGHTIAIMYLGKIVEAGPINDILIRPKHPYTQALIDSVSEPNPENLLNDKKIRVNDSLGFNVYEGCRFRDRCPYAIEKCKEEPLLEKLENNRSVACFVKIN